MLPKITHPIFTLNLPVSNTKITYRPMLVKEEKILLIAKEGNSQTEIIENVKAIIQNCVYEKLDFDYLPLVEAEYIFLNLRSKSINNIVPVTVTDPYDRSIKHKIDIDLDEVTISQKKNSNTIKIQDDIGIKLKLPTLNTIKNINQKEQKNNVNLQALKECIDCIYDSESVYKVKDIPSEEMDVFLENLSVKHVEMIKDYFDDLPRLNLNIEFIDSKGEKSTRTLDTFYDFFQ